MTLDAAKLQPPPARLALEHKAAAASAPARPRFTAPQKAALIIAALGPEAAGPIIERIGDKHMKAFAETFARLQKVPRPDLNAVVAEFLHNVSKEDDGELKGGFEEARNLVVHFKGDESAAKLLDAIDAPGGRTVWEKLAAIEEEALAAYLSGKSPQIAAVILSRMDLDKASSVLGRLADEITQEILARLANPVAVRPDALAALGEAINEELLAPMRKTAKANGPGEKIGAMLNNMSEEKRESLLKFIEEKSPELLADVKAAILTFKDLPERLPAKAVPLVTREVDVQTILKAAKFGRKNAPETVEFLFANISQRLVQQYEEQMQEMKPIPVAEAEAAQAQIMTAVRKLVADGAVELNKIEVEDDGPKEEMV
jgi:flagellar motor switch protein FliG